jgi:hypothetical protein
MRTAAIRPPFVASCQAPAFNLALAALSAAIAVFMAFYWVAENL